ncbi:MAG: RnfH family protein [Pseudomonadota bacterium]
MEKLERISIEVAFGLPEKQSLIALSVAVDTTVKSAIAQSGILETYSEIDIEKSSVGIWNRVCKLDDKVSQGDRIEIYRPLIADPKEVRKRRAEKAKLEGRADKVTGGRPRKPSSDTEQDKTADKPSNKE